MLAATLAVTLPALGNPGYCPPRLRSICSKV